MSQDNTVNDLPQSVPDDKTINSDKPAQAQQTTVSEISLSCGGAGGDSNGTAVPGNSQQPANHSFPQPCVSKDDWLKSLKEDMPTESHIPQLSEFKQQMTAKGLNRLVSRQLAKSHVRDLIGRFGISHAPRPPTLTQSWLLGDELDDWAAEYSQSPELRFENKGRRKAAFDYIVKDEGDPDIMEIWRIGLMTEIFGEPEEPHQLALSSDDHHDASLLSQVTAPLSADQSKLHC